MRRSSTQIWHCRHRDQLARITFRPARITGWCPYLSRHCERKRSNPSRGETSVDCFVAQPVIGRVHSLTNPLTRSAMANQIWTSGLRQIDPTGKSLLIFRNRVKPRLQKYFCFLPTQISSLIRAVPFRQEGRCATSSTWSGMRWTRAARETNAVCLRTVKSCGSDAPIVGVKPVRRSAGDGVKKRGHRGEREVSRKTIARGMPGCSGVTVVTNSYAFLFCMRGCGCIARPAFPAPSVYRGANNSCKTRAHRAAGSRSHI